MAKLGLLNFFGPGNPDTDVVVCPHKNTLQWFAKIEDFE